MLLGLWKNKQKRERERGRDRETEKETKRKRERESDKRGRKDKERERIIIPYSNTTYIFCHVTKRLYRTGPYHLSSSGRLHVPD